MLRRPLVLTGGPAVGKTVSARMIAAHRSRCAVIDVDDVRQLMISGGVPPWEGVEGERQQRLGVANACALARNFLSAEVDVVIADVLTPTTLALYKSGLPTCFVVHLVVTHAEAIRRSGTRRAWLTTAEFDALHDADLRNPPSADLRLHVDDFDAETQAGAIEICWATA